MAHRCRASIAVLVAALVAFALQGCRKEEISASAAATTTTATATTTTATKTTATATTATTTAATTTTTTTTTMTMTPPGASKASSGRLGSFLVLGDWGWDPLVHGALESRTCQQAIADAMAETMRELGDVRFVVNVGDSFYPDGVQSKNDSQWDSKWRDVYAPELRAVPWFSIYGNHDYHGDPCACSASLEDCAQVNGNISNLDYFYMPNTSWFLELPELSLEVVALDMNYYTWVNHTCKWTPCPEQCAENLKERMHAAFELFNARMEASEAPNMVVFSHYPTDYLWGFPWFLDALSNDTRRHIEYFGGHRHNVDQRSTTSTAPNNNWLVGGGGGWGCEPHYGDEQGFVVGEIGLDLNVTTYPVLVNWSLCCG